MTFDPVPYNLLQAFGTFLIALVAVSTIALIVGLVVSLLTVGTHGPGLAWEVMQRGYRDLTNMSFRRIGAIALLTWKESIRKKAFSVLVVFLILFLFAGWFLQGDSSDAATIRDTPAKVYIAFVLTTIQWMTLPAALLLACWGLPIDIKDRSLHTVVTKPVRSSEVVLGRIVGYSAVMSVFIAVMGIGGYIWILREVPDKVQDQLVSRVPVYGQVQFLDRNGEPSQSGLNVGDIWEFRGYVEGVTKAAIIWTFNNLDTAALAEQGGLRLENQFEAFRSYKGAINEPVRYKVTLVNRTKNLRVTNGEMVSGVAEFAGERQRTTAEVNSTEVEDRKLALAYKAQPSSVMMIPRKISYVEVGSSNGANVTKTVDLIDDLIDNNSLTVEVTCPDAQQYLGAAASDLFIRLPDKSFFSTYSKSIFMIWLMMLLVCMIGTTASCFVKGPVATLLTFSLIILGAYMRPGMEKLIKQYSTEGQVLGGGVLESFYRIITQMNQQQPLPDNFGSRLIAWIDTGMFEVLRQIRHVIPNFSYFNTAEYSANGFDVAWNTAMLPGVATALAYIIPCVLIGYFSLQLRELEAK